MSDRPEVERSGESAAEGGARGNGAFGSGSPRPGWRRDLFLQAGFLVGAAAGAAVTVLGRRAERSARRGIIDWRVVERVAAGRVRRSPGTLDAVELRRAEPVYAAAMAEIVPSLSRALGTELPGIVERSGVVDRATWVHANVATFSAVMDKIEVGLLDHVLPPGAGLVKSSMAIANRAITTRQMGFLLGFLGQRVLGQYDVALLSAEAAPGRLLFVDENIRRTAEALEVPLNPFRTWIALHETTHAFEFEAHPWLRPYLAERLERQLTSISTIATGSTRQALARLRNTLRGAGRGENWMEGLMSDEQRQEFREIQAVMSLLEGFGDYMMDEVGRDLVPDVEIISERFHARRAQRSAFERAMMRITAMDLKMEQYRKGEEFVAAIAKAGGPDALRRLWLGPATLPRPQEIDQPSLWIARVMPAN
jgi:coenzyme F420 biosynthesis associated uncharacterized protein